MTPYATLLVRPMDDDKIIRTSYHALIKGHHPDDNGGTADDTWYTVTKAYSAIKTEEKRNVWAHQQKLLAGVCTACKGVGVQGTRMFKGKIRVCECCSGKGRAG